MAYRILVVNVHSNHNAGDAALTMAMLQQLHDHFPGSEIILAMDDPNSHSGNDAAIGSFFRWVKEGGVWQWGKLLLLLPSTLLFVLSYRLLPRPCYLLTPRSWRRLLDVYTTADLVVSKPGGFLYSSGRGVSLLIALYTLWLAWVAGKPVYMFPQSIGPLLHGWERVAVKYVLSKLRIIMVREPVSLDQLVQCGLPSDVCHLLPDTAFAFQGVDPEVAQAWLHDQGVDLDSGPLLGMTTVNWSAQNPAFRRQDEYERACAAAIRSFVGKYQGKAVLFPQVTGPLLSQDDRVSARRVAGQLKDLGDAVLLIDSPTSADILRAAYPFMDVFVGTRMHSNIFALSGGVPTISIGYQPKTKGIASVAGMEDWSIEIEMVDEAKLVALLDHLWQERKALRHHLAQVMPPLRDQARLAGWMIEQDYRDLVEDAK